MSERQELTIAKTEELLVSLAREIAQDIFPIETILKTHNITPNQFETLSNLPRFQQYLEQALRAWNAASSTAERVRLRASTMVELSLAEMHARLHDPRESLNHKVELLKVVARIAEIGVDKGKDGQPSERIAITINMGADKEPLTIAAALPARVTEDHPPHLIAAE